jgi:putative ABC transport system permease protein
MSLLALIIALLAGHFLTPWFSNLTGTSLTTPWQEPIFWITLFLSLILISAVAGSYPAAYLSGFEPSKAFQEKTGASANARFVRKALVVFQFFIATILIIGTLIIYSQIQYIQKKELGFRKDQIIVINDTYALRNNLRPFKDRILQHSSVETGTISSYLPIPSSRSNSTYSKIREFRQDQAINMGIWYVDEDYADTYEIELEDGRFFDRRFPSDSAAVILNETAIGILGYDNPIGEKIYGLNSSPERTPTPEDFTEYTIIGVMKNFHFESLRENIGPLGMFLGQSSDAISFKINAEESASVISSLERTWNEMAPSQPFSYQFVDESFARIYEAEERVGRIAILFTLLAIIVSCLGLFGLSTFMVEQRTKEIGIRKVLGASVGQIVGHLSSDFIRLVLIAFLMACPIIWYVMENWLSNFAYHTAIRWELFAGAGMVALIIALLTVSVQSLRAALANPVDSLRSE